MKIPETRGISAKYHFDNMKPGDYDVAASESIAKSMRNSARKRGYKMAVRFIDNEYRVYMVGRIDQ